MKKIFYFLFLAAFGALFLSSCSDDDNLPAPAFSGVTVNGNQVTDAIDVAISESPLTLALSVENVDVVSYEWKLNDKAIEGATGATYSFTPELTGSYSFTVTAKNQDGIATPVTFTVNVTGTYRNGIFFYGTTNEDLAFYASATSTFYEGNIYEKVNGHMVSSSAKNAGGINDLYIYNNKLYLLTPQNHDSNDAKISVCDAQTLKEIKSITADGFNVSSLGFIYNMIPVNENKFYIGYNPLSNNSGIRVLKVNEDGTTTFSSTDIEGTGGAVGVNGPATFARMLKNGEDVLAACGSKIQVIRNDAVVKSIEVDADRQIADIVKGKDGKIYAIVAGKADKSSPYWLWMPTYTSDASIATIDPTTYSVAATTDLLDEGTRLNVRAGLEGNGAVASLTTDEIFFVADGSYAPGKIYSYSYTTGAISHVMTQTGGTCGKYMATDKDGMLYIPLIKNWEKCYTSVYRISDKQRMTDIESKIGVVSGDGGYASTYLFE